MINAGGRMAVTKITGDLLSGRRYATIYDSTGGLPWQTRGRSSIAYGKARGSVTDSV